MIAFVYALTDPSDGSTRWVGSTKCPDARMTQHLSRAQRARAENRRAKDDWILDVKTRGGPVFVVLEMLQGVTAKQRFAAERAWVDRVRAAGAPLLNTHYMGSAAKEVRTPGRLRGRPPGRDGARLAQIGEAVRAAGGNMSAAARALGITRQAVQNSIKYRGKGLDAVEAAS